MPLGGSYEWVTSDVFSNSFGQIRVASDCTEALDGATEFTCNTLGVKMAAAEVVEGAACRGIQGVILFSDTYVDLMCGGTFLRSSSLIAASLSCVKPAQTEGFECAC